mmetsp:Transcript_102234/g.286612  ORF Transcript_102234/g.286612 Transcript_102234/m.286612 type:complete len:309 (-) Transcript_102234:1740-2666(-)
MFDDLQCVVGCEDVDDPHEVQALLVLREYTAGVSPVQRRRLGHQTLMEMRPTNDGNLRRGACARRGARERVRGREAHHLPGRLRVGATQLLDAASVGQRVRLEIQLQVLRAARRAAALADLVDPQQQRVVDDVLAGEEVRIQLQLLQEVRSALLANPDALVGVLKVYVFQRDARVVLVGRRLPPHPRAFQVVPPVDLERRVEHVGHDNEVQLLDRLANEEGPPACLPHAEAVQAQKTDQQRPMVVEDVVVVGLQHSPEQHELLGSHCFQHVVAIGGVVEERTALALRRQFGQGGQVPEHHVAQQLLRA